MTDDAAAGLSDRSIVAKSGGRADAGAEQLRKRRPRNSFSFKALAAVVWLVFSVTLAAWWLVFGLEQIDRISGLLLPMGAAVKSLGGEIERQQRMLVSEGVTLVLLLLAGGLALLYYIRTEVRRSRNLREFFAAFTHDLKTSLASLRLQAESLEEDLHDAGGSDHIRLVKRLVKDTVRLELQLENSLLLASPSDRSRLLFEPIRLSELFEVMRHNWPDLSIEVNGDAVVRADRRALEGIFKNIFQNAVVHGQADRIDVQIDSLADWATVRVHDNGRGFKGDRDRLARVFERHSSTSGSGLGLYLASSLSKAMRGEVRFPHSETGFMVEVLLPHDRGRETGATENG